MHADSSIMSCTVPLAIASDAEPDAEAPGGPCILRTDAQRAACFMSWHLGTVLPSLSKWAVTRFATWMLGTALLTLWLTTLCVIHLSSEGATRGLLASASLTSGLLVMLGWLLLRVQLGSLESANRWVNQPAPLRSRIKSAADPHVSHLGEMTIRNQRFVETLASRDAALAQSELRFQTFFRATPEAISITRLSDGRYLEVNDGWLSLSKRTRAEVIGKTSQELGIWRNPSDRERLIQALQSEGRTDNMEVELVTGDGKVVQGLLSARQVQFDGEACLLAFTRDISERKRTEEHIHQIAYCDSLTQLPNRLSTNERLTRAIVSCKRTGRLCALMFLDLNKFKQINDQWGHDAGDMLLIEVAHRLTTLVRETDTVARFGGDEFVVLLEDLPQNLSESSKIAQDLAQKICAKLRIPYGVQIKHSDGSTQLVEHECSASIGVVVFSGLQSDAATLLKRADLAMYEAKRAGPNSVRMSPLEASSEDEAHTATLAQRRQADRRH